MSEQSAIRHAEARARLATRHASQADAERSETLALLHSARAQVARLEALVAREHAGAIHAQAAVDELRAVFKRWYLDAHAGVTHEAIVHGIAADLQQVLAISDEQEPSSGDAAWGSVWLHGNWRYLTKQMATPEREHAADAVARWCAALHAEDPNLEPGEPEGLRWWREDQ